MTALRGRVAAHNAQWEKDHRPVGGSLMPELRVWRVSHGLSQFEAAVRLGVSLSSWIRWETKGVPELRRAWLEEHCR
jgi:DNA-binding XRE family transcriptional regulator